MMSIQRPCFVYFLQHAPTGAVKIGCAAHLGARIEELRRNNPDDLKLLAHCSGTRQHERNLHFQFRAHRIRGEWFAPVAELMDMIDGIRRTGRRDA